MPNASAPLAERLQAAIARHGPISFRDFMEAALYDPQDGYYSAGKARVGRGGDFFTNVSVGSLFGRLLARQFAEMWAHLGKPRNFVLVEQGAHHGQCAADVLAGLRDCAPDCFEATNLWIVEPFPIAQEAQRRTLQPFADRAHWVDALPHLPPFSGVLYGNELLDAFPVHRIAWRGDDWKERAVDFQDGQFTFIDIGITSEDLRRHLAQLPPVPANYETEVNLASAAWVRNAGARMEAGFILIIDYGYSRAEYYRPERRAGTLTGYSGHRRAEDPLQNPGEIDLTAHVDFTAVAEAAEGAGLKVAGFTDQHHFMVGLGKLHFPKNQTQTPASEKELRAFKMLMHPGLMGGSFQALCLAKGVANRALASFEFAADPARLYAATPSQTSAVAHKAR